MARIRTIKPDAFTSESLSSVSVLARWTFAGLWTYLDDVGIGRADTRLIKAALFPLDDGTTPADIDDAMSELIDAGCIHTFMSGGKVYVHAPEFLRHQKINRPTASALPACSCLAHEPLTEDSLSIQRGKGREGKGDGKEGERASATRPPRTCPKHPNGTDKPCGPCADARKAHDAWQKPTLSGRTTMCGLHPSRRALNCPDCAKETATARPEVMEGIKSLARKKSAS